MSTQEREAMERLFRIENGETEIAVYLQTQFRSTIAALKDRNTVLQAALSRHARSLQPITVEGLVAMGDKWQRGRSTHLCDRVFMDIPDTRVVVEFWGDGQILWMANGHPVHSAFVPRNMLEVDERFGN